MAKAVNAVYQVRAGAADTWEVFEGTRAAPIASFGQRAAALRCAMRLARGAVNWQLLLGVCADVDRHETGLAHRSGA